MGSLHPHVYQIPEDRVDFILDYFSDCPDPSDADAYLRRFVDSFRERYPDAAAGRPRKGARSLWDSFIAIMKDKYTLVDGEPIMPPEGTEWLEYAAFEAIQVCGSHEICVGEILAQDAFVRAYGNLWRHLNGVCTKRAERTAAIALRKLMLDPEYADVGFLNEVQRNVHFLALLRPEEVRLLYGSIALLERFRAAVSQSGDDPEMVRLFTEDLERLTKYLASVEAEDTCLFSQSVTS